MNLIRPRTDELSESLILAQDKRWRRALCMQVERDQGFGLKSSGGRVSNTYVTCPEVGNNQPKGWLIPHVIVAWKRQIKVARRFWRGVRPIS